MTDTYAVLFHIPFEPGTTYAQPAALPELVHLDDPAMDVFTDFREKQPVTVEPEVSIDEALVKMKWAGVRLLLVVNGSQAIVGLITAKDIEGEKPVNYGVDKRVPRADIRVQDIMTPAADIQVLSMVSVRDAKVGHIVTTLREVERQHLLVAEVGEGGDGQRVVGLFSATQIARQLGTQVTPELVPANSLVGMLQDRGAG